MPSNKQGASGLGAGIVRKFTAEGAKVCRCHPSTFDPCPRLKYIIIQVVILDYNLKPLEGKTQPDSVKVVQGDVSDPESWKKALQTAIDAFGKVSIVCNNAGICTDSKVCALPARKSSMLQLIEDTPSRCTRCRCRR